MKENKQKSIDYLLIETFLVYVQQNLDSIESFIKELKKCKDPEEQRYRIFKFMHDRFNESGTPKALKLRRLLRESNVHRHIQGVKQQLEKQPVKNAIENIGRAISTSIIEKNNKKAYLDCLAKLDIQLLEEACQISKVPITATDMKYIICFAAEMDVKDICLLFNIEPTSVHTVRYRIKKKFAKEDTFRTLL